MSKQPKRDNPRRSGRGLSLDSNNTDEKRYSAKIGAFWQNAIGYAKNNRPVVKACILFAACIVVFMLIYSWLVDTVPFNRFVDFTTWATAGILHLFDDNVHAYYTATPYVASSAENEVRIGAACTGVVPILIFLAAIIAYPSTIIQKAVGFLLGILGLYTANIVRTTSLFAIKAHFPGFFDMAHHVIWQAVMILLAVVFWLIWVSRLTNATQQE